jgi:hypothetical protein
MPQLFYLLLHLLVVPITYCVCREKRNAQVTGANGRTCRNRRISSIAGSAASQDQQHRRNSSIAGTAASAVLLIAKLL